MYESFITTAACGIAGYYTYQTYLLRLLNEEQIKVLKSGAQPIFIFKKLYALDEDYCHLDVFNYGMRAVELSVRSNEMEIVIQNRMFDRDSHQHWTLTDKNSKSVCPAHIAYFKVQITYRDQYGAMHAVSKSQDEVQIPQL